MSVGIHLARFLGRWDVGLRMTGGLHVLVNSRKINWVVGKQSLEENMGFDLRGTFLGQEQKKKMIPMWV
jgi:hypothetical protein